MRARTHANTRRQHAVAAPSFFDTTNALAESWGSRRKERGPNHAFTSSSISRRVHPASWGVCVCVLFGVSAATCGECAKSFSPRRRQWPCQVRATRSFARPQTAGQKQCALSLSQLSLARVVWYISTSTQNPRCAHIRDLFMTQERKERGRPPRAAPRPTFFPTGHNNKRRRATGSRARVCRAGRRRPPPA